jgi:ATP-binding cassette subfamily C protein LapB
MKLTGNDLLDTLTLYTALYHKPFSQESLSHGLPLKPDQEFPILFSLKGGKSMFFRAAKAAGLESRLVQKKLEDLTPLVLPVIMVLKDDKACIVEEIKRTKAKVYVPEFENQPKWVNITELKEQETGFMFYLKKEYEYHDREVKKTQNKDKHWLWGTLRLSKDLYRDAIFASIVINIFILAAPLFTMNVYDRVIPNNAIDTLTVLSIGIGLVYTFDFILKLSRAYFLETAGKKTDNIISSTLFEQVMDVKMDKKPKSIGSFASNIRDFDSIRSFINSSTISAFVDMPFAILILVVIFIISGPLVLVPLAAGFIIFGYTYLIRDKIFRSIEETHEAGSNKNGILIESLMNLELIKVHGIQGHAQQTWEESTAEIANKSIKSKMNVAGLQFVVGFLTQLTTLAVIIVGVNMIQDIEMTMGALIAVVMLSGRVIQPMGQVAGLIATYQQTKAAYMSINDIMSLSVERPDGSNFVSQTDFKGKIEFKDVSFRYPGSETLALKNVSFTINPGDKVAILGGIGSGKSTIQKLIMGLYTELESGSIYIDNIDIKQIDPSDIRKNLSYVPQDINLFKGTLKQNITIQHPQAPDSKILRAAEISGINEFVKKHPRGFEMEIGEMGIGMSGGQKQSVAIALAFLDITPWMILDEPTSAMDQSTEKKVIRNMKEAMVDSTMILVTHRTNLLDMADKVMVMHNGTVAMYGEKNEILQKMRGSK